MSKDSLRDKIIAWLIDEDHEVKSEPIPPGAPLEWVLGVTAKIPPVVAKIIIQQPSTKRDRIVMTLGVMVSPEHASRLEALRPSERLSIFSDILTTLYSMCPDCVVVVQPSPAEPQNIIITRILYEEEVTRALVSDSVRVLVNALSMISTTLNARLEMVPKPPRRDEAYTSGFM